MHYRVELKPRAIKDMRRLSRTDAAHVADALSLLQDDLAGDVKRLTSFSPEYRLRVGPYRALSELEEGGWVMVYRTLHRREAYR